jgi:A/G-specific adenine glycosylase
MRSKRNRMPGKKLSREKSGRPEHRPSPAEMGFVLPSPTALRSVARRLLKWFARNARDLPWRRTRDPYAIWVSEVMLQQTQVKTVIPYWERWMRAFPEVHGLARAKLERVLKLWEGLGYYRRARNLRAAAQKIVQEHKGKVPALFNEVLALPGVGRYTAGAICSIAFNQPTPVLDGNVRRVLTRRFGLRGDERRTVIHQRLWSLAEALVRQAAAAPGRRNCGSLNQAVMELGALICAPCNPRCNACPLSLQCVARQGNRMEKFSPVASRPTLLARRFAAFVLENEGRYLVRQRPVTGVNAGLWEFPNGEVKPDASLDCLVRDVMGLAVLSLQPMMILQHAITRYRITLEVFKVHPSRAPDAHRLSDAVRRATNGYWRPRQALKRLPFTAAHGKIVERLCSADDRLRSAP